jgi:hypothetical protein
MIFGARSIWCSWSMTAASISPAGMRVGVSIGGWALFKDGSFRPLQRVDGPHKVLNGHVHVQAFYDVSLAGVSQD